MELPLHILYVVRNEFIITQVHVSHFLLNFMSSVWVDSKQKDMKSQRLSNKMICKINDC